MDVLVAHSQHDHFHPLGLFQYDHKILIYQHLDIHDK